MEPEVFPNGYWRWHSDLEFRSETAAVLLTLERDLFQTQILHLLHQVLMVKLNNYLKGIASPRQNIGR
jgi:hypothetical protein